MYFVGFPTATIPPKSGQHTQNQIGLLGLPGTLARSGGAKPISHSSLSPQMIKWVALISEGPSGLYVIPVGLSCSGSSTLDRRYT